MLLPLYSSYFHLCTVSPYLPPVNRYLEKKKKELITEKKNIKRKFLMIKINGAVLHVKGYMDRKEF